jgi:tetratricopeptide (TPR) repeat protein
MKKNRMESPDLKKYYDAVEATPESGDAHFKLGTALIQTGFLSRGEKALLRCVELDSKKAEAWVNLGGIRLSRWDFKGCIEANERALECVPNSEVALHNKGLGHLYLGEAEEMTECFKQVVELAPESAAGNYFLGVGLFALGEKQSARELLKKAVALGYSPDPKLVKELEHIDDTGADPVTILELGSAPEKQTDKVTE